MKQKTKKVLSVIVLSAYFLFLYFMLDYMTDHPLWILISVLASVVFTVTTHELGHLIFGYLTGYRFISYRIFSLMLIKENGKFRLCRNSVPGTSGQCLMAPPEKKNGKYPFVLYNLGGILFCGFLSLTPMILSAFVTSEHQTFGMCLFIFGFVSFVTNLFNAIPTNGKSMINDATNIRMALKSEAARNSLWNQLQYCALRAQNIRTADMPEELFFLPEKEDLENNLLIWQAIADIEREEDLGNYEKAREYVYFFLEHAPVLHPLFEGTLLSESIFLDSLLGYASKRTDGFYEKIKKNKFLQNMAFFHRTSYAYFVLYKKDSEQAKRSLENWQQALKKISSPEEKAFEERQMAYLENILSANL